MFEFLNDVTTYSEHPGEAAAFVVGLAVWCRFVFYTTRRFVWGAVGE